MGAKSRWLHSCLLQHREDVRSPCSVSDLIAVCLQAEQTGRQVIHTVPASARNLACVRQAVRYRLSGEGTQVPSRAVPFRAWRTLRQLHCSLPHLQPGDGVQQRDNSPTVQQDGHDVKARIAFKQNAAPSHDPQLCIDLGLNNPTHLTGGLSFSTKRQRGRRRYKPTAPEQEMQAILFRLNIA